MSFTRAAMKNDIAIQLNKTSVTRGFYTDDKMNSAISQAVDFVATKMFIEDEGWNHKSDYMNTPAACTTIDIPPHMAMIMEVRYLIGNTYLPLAYSQEYGSTQWSDASGMVQFPNTYRIVDNAFYFNPALGVGGPNYLQVEYVAYPKRFLKDTDMVDAQFDRAMYWFMMYWSCSVLVSGVQQFQIPWAQIQDKWEFTVTQIVAKRNQQSVAIADFEGC